MRSTCRLCQASMRRAEVAQHGHSDGAPGVLLESFLRLAHRAGTRRGLSCRVLPEPSRPNTPKPMTKPKHHLFICGSVRAGGEPQGICHKKQSIALLSYLQNEVQDRMLEGLKWL